MRILKNQYFVGASTLAAGTLLAQLITVLATPLLTRLYSPADFGLLAVFVALISSLTPAVCGKYEVAMVLPRRNIEAMHLLGIALRFTLGTSLCYLLVIFLFAEQIVNQLGATGLASWIYLVPLMLMFTGLMVAMTYFANRQQDYGGMAKVKILQATCVVLVNLMFGVLGFGFLGLALGTFVGLVIAAAYLVYLYRQQLSNEILTWGRAKAGLLKRYRHYPLYNASGALLDGITVAMPIFVLSHYFTESIVGYFGLLLRVASAPLSFVAVAVSQVNLKKIADMVNSKTAIRPYLLKITLLLSGIALLPSLTLIVFAPVLFTLVFGAQWTQAGVYLQILMPALAVRFVVSTLSSTLGATKNNRLGAAWKVLAFVITSAVLFYFAPKGDITLLFKAMAIMDVCLYLIYYLFIWHAAGQPREHSA